MAINYGELIWHIYPDMPLDDVEIQDDGNGSYIVAWRSTEFPQLSQIEFGIAWQDYLDTADDRTAAGEARAAAEEAERIDLSELGQQITSEVDYLNNVIATIDEMNMAQIQVVVKQLCQENKQILMAFRILVRREINTLT